jgi:uncharacterized protein YjiS (DUF1127 family)
MTTQCQKKANQTNAEKSTGPRSYAGRNRASKNSRKHGLTASPPWEDVTKWFRIILDDPDAAPDPMEREDRLWAALRLAEAEAQLERCNQTERAHLMRMTERARDDVGISFNDSLKRALKEPLGIDALKLMVERLDDPFLVGGTKIMIKRHPDRPVGLRATMHSLRRYRRSAEARRRKALATWILCTSQSSKKTKRTQI